MTANITQRVVSRRSRRISSITERSQRTSFSFTALFSQRGSVNHATVTIVFCIVALSVVSLLGFFYLQQVIGTASQGSDIHSLQSQVSSLKEQQRSLELQGAEIRSLQTVQEKVQQLNLVQSNNIVYLASTTDRVALAE